MRSHGNYTPCNAPNVMPDFTRVCRRGVAALSQKRVVKRNNASWVSDRPTCLTFCGNMMSKNAE